MKQHKTQTANKKLKLHIPGMFRLEGEGMTFKVYCKIVMLLLTFFLILIMALWMIGLPPIVLVSWQQLKGLVYAAMSRSP